MKKVFIIHGFEGSPNGAWRGWLMSELEKDDVYACALPMPNPEAPIQKEWVDEIARVVEHSKDDELYLVGHSLGSTAILRYLETTKIMFSGVILVSAPVQETFNRKIDNFFQVSFDYEAIKTKVKKKVVIHGGNDPYVLIEKHGDVLVKELDAEYFVIKEGGHLNGSAGWHALPECLEALNRMLK
ncbi:MAG: alpha/beta fold hydrolase [Candidatus Paceibacterota bacterium]